MLVPAVAYVANYQEGKSREVNNAGIHWAFLVQIEHCAETPEGMETESKTRNSIDTHHFFISDE
jgi:hypothetical protein